MTDMVDESIEGDADAVPSDDDLPEDDEILDAEEPEETVADGL